MGLFGGYQMPIQYSGGVKEEHMSVRENLGVFDVSHMGEFVIYGPNSFKLLQYICSNDIKKLFPGKAQYNYLPNDNGGIIDDLIVYQLEKDKYLLVVNASNIEKDWKWINKCNKDFNAEISNISDQTALLAIQGPKAIEAMQPLCNINLTDLGNFFHKNSRFAGFDNILVAKTGYTGSGGIEIYFDIRYAEKIWDKIMIAGKSFGISPIGLAARDTLRLEMGFCLYGNDINDDTSPIEAGLSWITKFNNSFNYSKELQLQKENGVQRKRVGFEMLDRGIARNGYTILNEKDEEIGFVTSGTMSPSLQKSIGMGYVNSEYAKRDTELYIQIRNKKIKAQVVKLPFFKS